MSLGHGEKLSRKQEGAIAALLVEPDVKSAARRIRLGVATLRRWLGGPGFVSAPRAPRPEGGGVAGAPVQAPGSRGVGVLRECLTSDRPGERLKAATVLFDRATQGVQLAELVEKVEELEEVIRQVRAATPDQAGGKS